MPQQARAARRRVLFSAEVGEGLQFGTAGDGDRKARTIMYVTEGDGARSDKMRPYTASGSGMGTRRRILRPLPYVYGMVAYTFEVFGYHKIEESLLGAIRVGLD